MNKYLYIEDFVKTQNTPQFIREIKSIIGVFILSPFFLFLSILVYFFIPQKLINYKKQLDIRSIWVLTVKRSLDIVIAFWVLLITFPIFIILPVVIKLDSRGPVFYKQIRVGKNRRNKERRNKIFSTFSESRNGDRRTQNKCGKFFTLFKFRTMVDNAEKKSGPIWAIDQDPRITNVGKFLRNFHLDELPQVFNILKGDMSFVGPRPERPYFINKFSQKIPKYFERFSVKPGLTGWAQINCGYDRTYEDVQKKLSYEMEYINRNDMIISDLNILLKTIAYLFKVSKRAENSEEKVAI